MLEVLKLPYPKTFQKPSDLSSQVLSPSEEIERVMIYIFFKNSQFCIMPIHNLSIMTDVLPAVGKKFPFSQSDSDQT